MLFKDISYVDDHYNVINHVNILIESNKIVSIGKNIPENYKGSVYNGNNKIALPGFINTHCHVPMVLQRGYGDDLPLDRWLHERMFPFEDRMNSEHMYWGSLLGISEMIKSGVVSFSDMYMYIEGITRAVDESGIKANIGRGCSSFDENQSFNELLAYQETKWLLDTIKTREDDRIKCDAAIHAEYTATKRLVTDVAQFAKEFGLRIQVHISETSAEHQESKKRRNGLTPTQFLDKLGVFEVPVIAAHCVWIDDNDIAILHKNNATISYCPSSNLKLGSGFLNAWKLLNIGINISIGTDGAASNNNLNGLEEINLASMLQKGLNQDPVCFNMAETLKIATMNGAKAQGREECGSIKMGNRADIVVFDLDKPHLQPACNPLANILYAAQANDICLTMVDGQVLYKDNELLTIDEEKVIYNCKEIQKNILNELNK